MNPSAKKISQSMRLERSVIGACIAVAWPTRHRPNWRGSNGILTPSGTTVAAAEPLHALPTRGWAAARVAR